MGTPFPREQTDTSENITFLQLPCQVVNIIVMGWQSRLKFNGKTNRSKISLQNAYFYYFGQFRVFL